MSRSNAPLQATINKWVNPEAIRAYAERVREWGRDEQNDALLDQDDNRLAIGHNLLAAAKLLDDAADAASAAARASTDAAYDRIYEKVRP